MTTCPLGGAELLRVHDKAEVFRWLYTVRNRWSQRLCLPLSLSFDMQIESSQRMTDALVWLSRTTGPSKHTDLSGRKKGSDTTRHRIDSPTLCGDPGLKSLDVSHPIDHHQQRQMQLRYVDSRGVTGQRGRANSWHLVSRTVV